MRLLNSLEYEGKTYDLNSIGPGGFVSAEAFGLPGGFYGGRVDKVAYTDVDCLYMCMEGMKVIDLLLAYTDSNDCNKEVEGLLNPDDFTAKELIDIAAKLDKEVPSKATKAEIVGIIGKINIDEVFKVVNKE